MDSVRADLRQLDFLDIQKQGFPLARLPAGRSLSKGEKDVLKSAVHFGKSVVPQTGLLLEPIGVSEKPPAVTVIPPIIVPVGISRIRRDFTLAVGFSSSLYFIFGVSNQLGLYGSNTPELGVFASIGGGVWTNVGISVGPAITMIFGPPSYLSGVSWGIGADVAFMGGTVGAMLLFSPPPFHFLGIQISLTIGVTVVPAAIDFELQVTNTFVKPLLK